MRKLIFCVLLVFLCVGAAPAQGAWLYEWQEVTTLTTGDPVADVTGYRVYCAATSDGQPPVPDGTGYFVAAPALSVLAADACPGIPNPYGKVTAVSASKGEGGYSNQAACAGPAGPGVSCSQQ